MAEIKKFYEEIAKNPELLKKVQKIGEQKEEEDFSDVARLAKSLGFNITVEDLSKFSSSASNEVSHEELENVVGGTSESKSPPSWMAPVLCATFACWACKHLPAHKDNVTKCYNRWY